jgi:hypothetical protein
MAGFPGGRKPLGAAGIPPSAPGPTVSESSSIGTDTFYLLGLTLAEDTNPTGSGNHPVRITESGGNATDSYYVLGFVLAEPSSVGTNAGRFRILEQGSVGSDTYYVLGFVLAE